MPRDPKHSVKKERSTGGPAPGDLRKKQILVVVLVIGLVIALLTQPSKDTASQDADIATPLATVSPAVVPVASNAAIPSPSDQSRVDASVTETRTLPRMELSRMVELTLLTTDSSRPAPPVIQDVPKIQAIYGTSNDRAALIGRTIVRGGQPLPGGGKILKVTDDGVRLGQE